MASSKARFPLKSAPSLGGHPVLDLTNNDEVWLVP